MLWVIKLLRFVRKWTFRLGREYSQSVRLQVPWKSCLHTEKSSRFFWSHANFRRVSTCSLYHETRAAFHMGLKPQRIAWSFTVTNRRSQPEIKHSELWSWVHCCVDTRRTTYDHRQIATDFEWHGVPWQVRAASEVWLKSQSQTNWKFLVHYDCRWATWAGSERAFSLGWNSAWLLPRANFTEQPYQRAEPIKWPAITRRACSQKRRTLLCLRRSYQQHYLLTTQIPQLRWLS